MANDIKVIVKAILDDKNFKKGIKGIKGGFDDASKKAKKHGSVMGKLKGAYLAIAAVMTGAVIAGLSKVVKAGIDAQETFSKFATVFRAVGAQAETTATEFADAFGLSSMAAKQLLGDTGDLLSGFGFTGQAALDMSKQVNELAVDLASFTNFSGGAAGASAALTKGLLGERESMKSLGIAIGEVDIKQRALLEGMDPKRLTRQQKAMLTLKIAMEQSKNAIGDFARTQTQAANQIRILRARFENVVVTLGSKFIPVLERALPILNEWMASIDKALKDVPKTIQEFRSKSEKALSGFLDSPLAAVKAFVVSNQQALEKIGANIGLFLLKVLNMALKFTGKFANLFAFAFNGIVTAINKIAGTSIPTLGEAFEKMTESLDFAILEMEASMGKFADSVDEANEQIVESEKEKNAEIVKDATLTNAEIATLNKELQEVNKSIRKKNADEEIVHLEKLLSILRSHGMEVISERTKLNEQIDMLEDALFDREVERFIERSALLSDFVDVTSDITDALIEIEEKKLKGIEQKINKEYDARLDEKLKELDLESTTGKELQAIRDKLEKERFEKLTEDEKTEFLLRKKFEEEQRKLADDTLRIEKENEKERLSALAAGTKEQKDELLGLAKFSRNVSSFSAAVDAVAAVVKTMASVPYPLNIPLAAAQGIAGALRVSKIRSEPLPSFAMGTEALDRDSIIQAHEGERIVPAEMNIQGMSNEALMLSALRGLSIPGGAPGAVTNNNQSEATTNNVENIINVPEGTTGIDEVLTFAERTNSRVLRR